MQVKENVERGMPAAGRIDQPQSSEHCIELDLGPNKTG